MTYDIMKIEIKRTFFSQHDSLDFALPKALSLAAEYGVSFSVVSLDGTYTAHPSGTLTWK